MHGNTNRECWSIGELEYWNESRRVCCFSVFVFSITPLLQKYAEIKGITKALWG